jgi:hypothetical protein
MGGGVGVGTTGFGILGVEKHIKFLFFVDALKVLNHPTSPRL